MHCDIVIPVWNLKEDTERCVESLIKNTEFPFRLIIIDNGSRKKTKAYLESLKSDGRLEGYILIRNEENLGYTRATNQGMEIADGEYICLLNNDTIMTKGWLKEMVRVAELSPDIGIVNPSSNNLGHYKPWYVSLEEYARRLKEKYSGYYIEMATAIGFCYLIKKEVIQKIGILMEKYGLGNFEDTEYSIRAMRYGYKSVTARGAYVYHKVHASFNMIKDWEAMFENNQEVFRELFGMPKRIVYALKKQDSSYFRGLRDETYDLARKCNWITVFLKGSIRYHGLKVHSNIKVFRVPSIFFRPVVLFRILTKKKKFGKVVTDDKKLLRLLARFGKIASPETELLPRKSDGGKSYFAHERRDLLEMIPGDARKILDVGCAGGAMGSILRERGSEVVGIEKDKEAFEQAKANLTEAFNADVENFNFVFPKGHFDCIVYADILEHCVRPLSVLKKHIDYLGDGGSAVISLPNIRYYKVIKGLIFGGSWDYVDAGILDESHVRFFAFKNMTEMFWEAGYAVSEVRRNVVASRSLGLLNKILVGSLEDFLTYQYYFLVRKKIPSDRPPKKRKIHKF